MAQKCQDANCSALTMNSKQLQIVITTGIILYFLLFFIAAYLYPGGSQFDPEAIGYSWQHNYWCNLDNPIAFNGQLNTARPFAVSATIILCFTLAIFFYNFAHQINISQSWKSLIKFAGISSMLIALFIMTDYHDEATLVATIFAFIALIGLVRGLILNRFSNLLYFGLFCIILMAVNNFIYYTKLGIYYLPLLQKITFFIVLFWVLMVNWSVDNTSNSNYTI